MSKRAHVLDREGHRSQDTEVTKKRRQPLPSTGFPLSPPSTLRQEKQPGRVDGWWTELEAPLESGSTSDNEDWEPAPHPHMAAARISPELFTPSPVDPDDEEVEPVTHFLDMAAARISPEILTPSPVDPDEEEVEPVTHFLDMAAARISPEILTPSPVDHNNGDLEPAPSTHTAFASASPEIAPPSPAESDDEDLEPAPSPHMAAARVSPNLFLAPSSQTSLTHDSETDELSASLPELVTPPIDQSNVRFASPPTDLALAQQQDAFEKINDIFYNFVLDNGLKVKLAAGLEGIPISVKVFFIIKKISMCEASSDQVKSRLSKLILTLELGIEPVFPISLQLIVGRESLDAYIPASIHEMISRNLPSIKKFSVKSYPMFRDAETDEEERELAEIIEQIDDSLKGHALDLKDTEPTDSLISYLSGKVPLQSASCEELVVAVEDKPVLNCIEDDPIEGFQDVALIKGIYVSLVPRTIHEFRDLARHISGEDSPSINIVVYEFCRYILTNEDLTNEQKYLAIENALDMERSNTSGLNLSLNIFTDEKPHLKSFLSALKTETSAGVDKWHADIRALIDKKAKSLQRISDIAAVSVGPSTVLPISVDSASTDMTSKSSAGSPKRRPHIACGAFSEKEVTSPTRGPLGADRAGEQGVTPLSPSGRAIRVRGHVAYPQNPAAGAHTETLAASRAAAVTMPAMQ